MGRMKVIRDSVECEALHFDGTENAAIGVRAWMHSHGFRDVSIAVSSATTATNHVLAIGTPGGHLMVHPGDYVVRGADGRFYPERPDVFRIAYAANNDPSTDEIAADGSTGGGEVATAYDTILIYGASDDLVEVELNGEPWQEFDACDGWSGALVAPDGRELSVEATFFTGWELSAHTDAWEAWGIETGERPDRPGDPALTIRAPKGTKVIEK